MASLADRMENRRGKETTPPGRFAEMLEAANAVTFDIFDTLVSRDALDPQDAHIEVARRLSAAGIRAGRLYKRQRLLAEQEANRAKQATATLGEIFSILAERLSWTTAQCEHALATELAVEREMALPLGPGVDLLARTRQAGKFLGFVSDMYLSADFIHELLERAGVWHDGDRLWVSCESGASKADGSLFRKIHAEANCAFAGWLHVGDNPKGDGTAPASLGIWTFLLPRPSVPRRIEKLFPGTMFRRRTPTETSLCAAIERAVQNCPNDLDKRQSALWEATCTSVAPLVCNFTLWALHSANRIGLRDLWCLARDGQTVHRAAQILLPAMDLAVSTRYMPASRQVFRLAGLREVGDFELSWLLGTYGKLAPAVVAERLGGGEPIRRGVASALESVGRNPAEDLDADGCRVLRDWARSPVGRKLICDSAAQQRELFLEFLEQQGVTKPFGVLDIGWAGSLQDGLRKIFDGTFYQQNILHGFYFGLLRSTNRRPDSELHGFLFQPETASKLHRKAIQVFEMFFAADHPQVQKFDKEEDGRVTAEFLGLHTWQAQLDWGAVIQQQAVLTLARELRPTTLPARPGEWTQMAENLLRDFLLHPTTEEAAAYSSWIVSSFVGIETGECLGPTLTAKRHRYYMKHLALTGHHWQPIMRKVNRPVAFWSYKLERYARYLLHKLRP